MKTYAKVTMPLVGLIAATSRPWFENTLPQIATDLRGIITVDKALHWLCEEPGAGLGVLDRLGTRTDLYGHARAA